ncbi:GFA family protein [Luteimonas sp. MC1572]|uniref:GFA family protein n=1 Tax=Luteimonas sp. MC1572 TaxID=2799325 RepID=UPI0018F094D5|nr:GFA family protein [Luteimonas sp. MC1572]MBJ6980904.1 GFA family protein [Luteimonas sp. MC1572]QQO02260.1 GFA family protein [Luteimonas sp. MC1572]
MHLEGSCHCGKVRFRCQAYAPVPYQHCYCSICRKTAGGSGSAVNLGARADTLVVEGREHVAIYRARIRDDEGRHRLSSGRRHFCKHCGSALWLFDPEWPELVHPHASAIDTPLPRAVERVHMLLDSKANWVEVPDGRGDVHLDGYPDESLEDWHRRHGQLDEIGAA